MSDLPILRLLDIMRRLRDPETGCPWDRAQDYVTLAPYTLEEASEVVDVLERGDLPALRDELGDLLFQIVCAPNWMSRTSTSVPAMLRR